MWRNLHQYGILKYMKKILNVLLVLLISFVVIPVFAKTTPTPEPTVIMEQKVEYSLPYPGILPDHPLFFLKRLRDQIMEKLIADPVRKIEFYVLQADKYMNMGVFLIAKNNEALAVETMISGAKRMGLAISAAVALKDGGKEVPTYLVEKLTNALAKYKEVSIGYPGVMNEITKLGEELAKLAN